MMNRVISAFLLVSLGYLATQFGGFVLSVANNEVKYTEVADNIEPRQTYAVIENIVPAKKVLNRYNAVNFINDTVEIIQISSTTISKQELTCLATNIYHEARGESDIGKIAVAHVTLNRVNSYNYPDTICGVVHQTVYSKWWLTNHGRKVPARNMCQFSWYCDGKSDKVDPFSRGWQESIYIAMAVLVEKYHDPTHGATHYYNPRLANPQWAVHYEETATIGNHCFHRM
jgi:spore germination cell wall hydrolase CwlJ-like protein